MPDAVELRIEPRVRPVGAGTVRRLLPFARRRMVGPFIFCDLMGPEDVVPGQAMNVDAHPHIGLSTLTYLLEGRMVHRDSTGAVQTIDAGAVNWMTAGSGVTHTERSHPDDIAHSRRLLGLQLWVALPNGGEDVAPSFEHCPVEQVPRLAAPGTEIRLAAGSGFGIDAPVSGSSPLVLARIELADGAVTVPADHPERAVLAVQGDLELGGSVLPEGQLAVLAAGVTPVLRGTGIAVLLGGAPVGPRRIWWNFVHSDPERIEAAKADWDAQRFPLVPDDHDPWVPRPR